MKITAKVQNVFPVESIPTRQGGQFQKREVWAVDESNPQYPNPLVFEFSGNAVTTPDRLAFGMIVEFDCAVQGNAWVKDGVEKRAVKLRSWGVTIVGQAPQPYNPQQPQPMPQYAPQPQAGPYGQPNQGVPAYQPPQQVNYQPHQQAPGFVPNLNPYQQPATQPTPWGNAANAQNQQNKAYPQGSPADELPF